MGVLESESFKLPRLSPGGEVSVNGMLPPKKGDLDERERCKEVLAQMRRKRIDSSEKWDTGALGFSISTKFTIILSILYILKE